MKSIYHRQITIEALQARFSSRALHEILRANLGQDKLGGQIGHDEYHFDANAFARGWAYIDSNRAQVFAALAQGCMEPAWKAFGRLIHAAQDFYAHSNYVLLWLERFPRHAQPLPDEIDPLVPDLLHSPALRSGRLYYPLEALSFIPVLKRIILPLLPQDSHAWMNLDSPEQGEHFTYAYVAAVKRTQAEQNGILQDLTPAARNLFEDRDDGEAAPHGQGRNGVGTPGAV